jgi:6-phosphogluconolactonase (cycloisomerase 2 family)
MPKVKRLLYNADGSDPYSLPAPPPGIGQERKRMKFRNFGQASLAILATLAATIGVSACKQNYTTGYMYVTGTQQNTQAGQIGAFKINSTNGALFTVPGQPFPSGGSNPIRALVDNTGRFVFVLNQGVKTTDSTGNVSFTGNGLTVFSVGGDGSVSPQQTYQSTGYDSQRLAEFAGQYLYVLDEYAPAYLPGTQTIANASSSYSSAFPCEDANGVYHPVGAVTAFSVNSQTGILTLIQNQQQNGITYFPVGCFPVDMHIAGGYVYVMDAGSASNSDVETVFPYLVNTSTGALTVTTNGPFVTGATNVTVIDGDAAGKYVFLLDAGTNKIYMYTPGTNGSLTNISGSPFANDSAVSDPDALLVDSKDNFLYVANAQSNGTINSGNGAITFFNINPTSQALSETPGSPYGNGSAPDCIVVDPTNQFIYTSDYVGGTIVGNLYNPQAGNLAPLHGTSSQFSTVGNPTWCAVDSHTD